jgi:hypothetical protein
MELNSSDRLLYLAVPVIVYEALFQREFLLVSVERYQIRLIIYDPISEVVMLWKN